MTFKVFIKKYWTVILVAVCCIGVLLLFSSRKKGVFIDEVYTFGLSNSYYKPYLTDVKDGTMIDKIFTSSDIKEYLTVGDSDRFAAGSVYYNQTRDVHPPLYYWLFNFAYSLFPGNDSLYIGTGLNGIIFIFCLFLMYKLCMLAFGNSDISAAGVALLGLSTLAISCVMMLRMYTLLMLFTLLLAYLVLKLIRSDGKKIILYPLIMLTVFGGVMTQYYFAFYAMFLTLTYIVYALVKKNFNSAMWFAICSALGVALMVAVFPECIRQLLVGNGQVVGGQSIIKWLTDVSQYGNSIRLMWSAVTRLKGMKYILLISIVLFIFLIKGAVEVFKEKNLHFDSLLIIFPIIPTFLLIAIISPVKEYRYFYNLIPLAAMFICFILNLNSASFGHIQLCKDISGSQEYFNKGLVIITAAVCLLMAKTMPPDNLYSEHQILNKLCDAHKTSPVVYITNDKFASPTQDLLQLKHFNSFFVTNNLSSEKMKDYIGQADEAILYIDTNSYWSSGYDENEILNGFLSETDFNDSQLLYKFTYEGVDGLSSTYVITNK